MTIKWTGFPAATTATSSDVLVGLASGTTNARFNANSFLFKANNLSDVASKTDSFNNLSPLTSKGDLIWFNGTSNDRLGIGSLNQILAVGASNIVNWINNPALLISNNLSDLSSVSSALTNLGLSASSNVTFNEVTGTTSVTSASFISTGLNLSSYTNNITAHAGGGQSSATQLTTQINLVKGVVTAGDSVKLPVSAPGLIILVTNSNITNACDCFPASGEAINNLATNTAFSIATSTSVMFICGVSGIWNTILSA